jgi:hypothetical protein
VNTSITLSSLLDVNGNLEIWSGGSINTSTNFFRVDNNTLTIKTGGSITVPSSGTLAASDEGATINVEGGTITVSGGSFRCGNTTSASSTVNLISGTINITSGTVTAGATTNATGTINISGGTFSMSGGTFIVGSSSSTGSINQTGGTVSISGSTTILVGNDASATASINISGGTFNFSGSDFRNGSVSSATGTINISGGTFNTSGGNFSNAYATSTLGYINITGGSCNISGGTFVNGNSNGCTGNITVSGGTLDVQTGGTFENSFNAISTGNLTISGGKFKITGGTLYNGKTDTNTGNINITSGLFSLSSGTLSNASAGIGNITVSNQAQFKLGGGSLSVGAGTNSVTIFGHDFSSSGISSGTMTVGSSLTIPAHAGLHIDSSGTLTNGASGSITNNGTLFVFSSGTVNNTAGGTITNNGVFLNNGTYNGTAPSGGTTYDATASNNTIPSGSTFTIPDGYTLSISDGQTLFVNGVASNQSASSIDIYGTVYTYSTLENGTPGIPGTLTVHQNGKLVLLSGNLVNRHASSAVNINSGGELDNFYGNVNITNGSLTLASGGNFTNVRGSDPGTFTNNNGLYFNTAKVILADDLDIDYTWTITEKATIHGNHNKINFGTNGAIVIYGPDASLLLKDVIVDNISGNQIRCTDNTTTLSIDNVTWIQDANYSFTMGQTYIDNNWLIKGTGTSFSYQTNQTSTINSNATLELRDTTFNYDTASNNLLEMIDSTSSIKLDQATLQATQACTLSNGKIVSLGFGILKGDATLNLQALDNIDAYGGVRQTGTVLL